MKRSVFLLLDYHPDKGETHGAKLEFVLSHARLADSLGYEALWIAEHHFERIGGVPNPAVLLAAVAAQTKHLRIGPSVSILPYRDPIFVAEDYAIVDLLSQGRLNMGVGCGSQEAEFAGLGIDFQNRRDAHDLKLVRLRELWSQGTLNVAPHQSPPPLYIATVSPVSARAVGQRGDSVITILVPGAKNLEGLEKLLVAHREGLREGGHAPDAAEVVVVQLAHVAQSGTPDREQVVPALSRLLSVLEPNGGALDAESMFMTMQNGSTGCFGTPRQAQGIVTDLASLGVEHVAFVTRFGGLNADAANETIRLLAPELTAPSVRSRAPESRHAQVG